MTSDVRTAWNSFCQALHDEGNRVLDGATDAISMDETAEALRCVSRLAQAALLQRTSFNDPDFPTFFRALDDRFPYAGPDAYITYLAASVREDATYRVSGTNHGRMMSVGNLWADDLDVGADGSVEVTLSADASGPNTVRIPAGADPTAVPDMYPMASGGLVIRAYHTDPADPTPPAELIIERIDEQRPDVPAPFSAGLYADQLMQATELFRGMSRWWLQRAQNIRVEHEPNVIGPPGTRPPGVPNFTPPADSPLYYGVLSWELGPGDAMVIETPVPRQGYWSFQLYNSWWESPDVQNRQTSISCDHAHLDRDGRFRAVISHTDPGVPNWLDTGTAPRGFLFYRWLLTAGDRPEPTAQKITHGEVRDHLPASHPTVGVDERREQLAARRRFFAKRWQR